MKSHRLVFIIMVTSLSYLCLFINYQTAEPLSGSITLTHHSTTSLGQITTNVPSHTTSLVLSNGNNALKKCYQNEIVKHFVFTKVEKTGSTTMFTILTRFVCNNRLTVLAPLSAYHINWERERGKLHGWDIGPGEEKRADVLADHAIYNKSMLDKYMVKGYKHLVIVREPIAWYKSAVQFFSKEPSFHLPKSSNTSQNPPEYFLMNKSLFYQRRSDGSGIKSWFHLGQLQWLGFDYKLKSNITAIKEYVSWIRNRTDVIILTEQFDASLVILRQKLCWNYTDIFYKNHMVQKRVHINLSTEAINKLISADYNLGDKLLYDSLNGSWWKQPELGEGKFWDEVAHFTELNTKVSREWCEEVIKFKKSHMIPASQWHPPLHITQSLCIALKTKTELRDYVLHH